MAEWINCAVIRFPMLGKMEAEQALSRPIDAKCTPRRQIGNAESASVPVSHYSVGAGKSNPVALMSTNPEARRGNLMYCRYSACALKQLPILNAVHRINGAHEFGPIRRPGILIPARQLWEFDLLRNYRARGQGACSVFLARLCC